MFTRSHILANFQTLKQYQAENIVYKAISCENYCVFILKQGLHLSQQNTLHISFIHRYDSIQGTAYIANDYIVLYSWI